MRLRNILFRSDLMTEPPMPQPVAPVAQAPAGVVPHSPSSEETHNFGGALMWHNYDAMAPLKLSAVYAALSIISNSIATLPIYVPLTSSCIACGQNLGSVPADKKR